MPITRVPWRGWNASTYRIFLDRPLFPWAALLALVYGFMHYLCLLYWLCTLRFTESAYDYWRAPLVAGISLITILIVLDIVFVAWLAWVFVRRLRRPWRLDRVTRVACLAGFGSIVLLLILDLSLAQFPARMYALDSTSYFFLVGEAEVTFHVLNDLIPEDGISLLRKAARADGGRGRGGTREELGIVVSVPGPRFTLPLRGFVLLFENGVLRAGDQMYGPINDGDDVRVTPVGISVRSYRTSSSSRDWDYRGELPR